MSRSEAAIRRGQTGFLKPIKRYIVRLLVRNDKDRLLYMGPSKKDAWATGRRWLKNTQDENSFWFGDIVRLTCNGDVIPTATLENNHHAPKEL